MNWKVTLLSIFVLCFSISYAQVLSGAALEDKIMQISPAILPENKMAYQEILIDNIVCLTNPLKMLKGECDTEIPEENNPWVIEGRSVYYETQYGKINVFPALAEEITDHTQYVNYTYVSEVKQPANISFSFDTSNRKLDYFYLYLWNGAEWEFKDLTKTEYKDYSIFTLQDVGLEQGDNIQMKINYYVPEYSGKYTISVYQGTPEDMLDGKADILTVLDPWWSGTTTGGTVTYDGNYTVVTFESSGTLVVKYGDINATVLVVGAGGGGADLVGAGGGGGGLQYNSSFILENGSYTVTIGAGPGRAYGPSSGGNGGNSFFGNTTHNITARGGFGGIYATKLGGAPGNVSTSSGWGGNASGIGTNVGGNGNSYNITGASVYYGGGGGGYDSGNGGLGGGGEAGTSGASSGDSGTDHLGGGGGGGGDRLSGSGGVGGDGGDGVVIIRYISHNINVSFNTSTTNTSANHLSPTINANVSVHVSGASIFQQLNVTLYNGTGGIVRSNLSNTTPFYVSFTGLPYGNYSLNATANDTENYPAWTETRYIFVNQSFELSAVSPANNSVVAGTNISFNYNLLNLYPITDYVNCSLFVDGVNQVNRTVTVAGSYTDNVFITEDAHTWFVSCVLSSNSSWVINTSLHYFISGAFSSYVPLAPVNGSIYNTSQSLFYDSYGLLNMLYFTNESGIDYVNIYQLNGTTINNNWKSQLNITKPFFLAMLEPNNVMNILTFKANHTFMHFIYLYPNGSISVTNKTTTFVNVTGNDYFDAYTYAYTKQYSVGELNLTYNSSFYLFKLPMNNGSIFVKKYIGNESLVYVAANATIINSQYMTLAENKTLTRWYGDEMQTTGFYRISTYTWAGGFATNYTESEAGLAMSFAVANASHIIYESYGGQNYHFLAGNGLGKSQIYRINDGKNFTIQNDLTNPSDFVFIDNNTFIFYSNETTGNFVYSCYFGGADGDCIKISAADYGATVPYNRGAMTTSKMDGISSVNTRGMIVSGSNQSLAYTTNTYDYKFLCKDEMDETGLQFVMQIYTNTTGNVLQNASWGYAMPSALFGPGQIKFYQLGASGTVRLFLFGSSASYPLIGYSLNSANGQYFTFTVVDASSNPIQNVTVTATRFSPDNGAYVTIEQGITDSQGKATLFLESTIPYKINAISSSYNPLLFDYSPLNGSNFVTLVLRTNVTINYTAIGSNFNTNIGIRVTPPPGLYNSSQTLTFTITDSDSSLEYYGISIYQSNGRNPYSLYYNNTVYGQPAGGSIVVNLTTNHSYKTYKFYKIFGQPQTEILDDTHVLGDLARAFKNISDKMQDEGFIKGWYIYFVGIFITMLTVGFVAKYSPEGAGFLGLMVLWAFTMFAPTAIIVTISDPGLPPAEAAAKATVIVAWMVSTVTTVCVVAVMYLKQYWT